MAISYNGYTPEYTPTYYTSTSSSTPTWFNTYITTTTSSSTNTAWYTLHPTYYETNTAWLTWQNNATSSGAYRPQPQPVNPRSPRQTRRDHNGRRSKAQTQQAVHRSKRLLLRHLTPEQREQFREKQCFTVVSKSGHRYEIRVGLAGNVYRLDKNGKRYRGYCCHVSSKLPIYDNLLTQKLALEHDEDRFLQLANVTSVVY